MRVRTGTSELKKAKRLSIRHITAAASPRTLRRWAVPALAENLERAASGLEAPPDACIFGWQESLTLLAKLVEAEIPD